MNFVWGKVAGALDPMAHVALWFFVHIPGIAFGATAILLLKQLGGKPPPPNTDLYFVISGVILVAFIRLWRRYWFLPSDLARLMLAKGGTVMKRRMLSRSVKGQLRDLWVIGRMDHPIFGYYPPYPREPRDPISGSPVSVFRLGEWGPLPHIDARVRRHAVPSVNNPRLDLALRSAAEILKDGSVELIVEIRDRWLRVEVRGGTWLGTAFGRRIGEAIAFAERLSQALGADFTPLDPARWTVEPEGASFRVVEFGPLVNRPPC